MNQTFRNYAHVDVRVCLSKLAFAYVFGNAKTFDVCTSTELCFGVCVCYDDKI